MRTLGEAIRVQVLLTAVTPFVLIDVLLQPLSYGVVVGAISQQQGAALVAGTALFGVWGAIVTHGVLAVMQDKQWRTLDLVVASPAPTALALAGKVAAAAGYGVFALPAAWITVAVLWRPPAVSDLSLFIGAIAVGFVGFVGLGLLLVGLVARYRYFAGMLNGLYEVSAVLGCLFAPAVFLPGFVRPISWFFGPSWAMEAVRGGELSHLIYGASASSVMLAVGVLYLSRMEAGLRRKPETFFL